jgi:hypothetical protein
MVSMIPSNQVCRVSFDLIEFQDYLAGSRRAVCLSREVVKTVRPIRKDGQYHRPIAWLILLWLNEASDMPGGLKFWIHEEDRGIHIIKTCEAQ